MMMEVVRLVDSVLKKLEYVRTMIKDDKKARIDLQMGLGRIKSEMAMMSKKVEDIWSGKAEKPEQWIFELQELAYEIEDFIECRARDPQTSAPNRLLHVAMVMDPLPEHLARIQGFQNRISDIQNLWKEDKSPPTMPPRLTPEAGGSGHSPAVSGTSARSAAVGSCSPRFSSCEDEHLGTGKTDLLELLSGDDGQQKELKVISILGCSGYGKTSLARAVHEDRSVVERFPCRAFVDVSVFNHASEILHSIHQQVRQGPFRWWPWASEILHRIHQQVRHGVVRWWPWHITSSSDLPRDLHKFLRDKRYLVIIDGVQLPQDWSVIEAAFPSNDEGSRVVVCTRVQSVATVCSTGSYLYKIRALNREESQDLFWRKLGGDNRSRVLEIGLETLFNKCEGLPEALVRAAEYLSQYGAALTEQKCKEVGVALGNYIAGDDPAFGEMKRALAGCYDSLNDQGHKACMLSVGTFPRGHRISRKSLLRRWKAEGLLVGDVNFTEHDVALHCLDKLVDLGVIEPVLLGDNSQVKRYKVYGVMLEFIVHRSVSWNYITLIHNDRVVRNHDTTCAPRRLSVHGMGGTGDQMKELSRIRSSIRSLTICDSNKMDFDECMLLRVLDLEGCAWLEAVHLDTISKLLHLKYLNLRSTQVSELPREMKDLHCLETLDARDTRVEMLPMEVLMLPQLVHLFGEFELPAELGDAGRKDKIKIFFSEKSRLQTLAGFKIVKNRGFEQILLHCNALRKVKIWCRIPPPPPPPPPRRPRRKIAHWFKIKDVPIFSESLVTSLAARSSTLDSLSIDFNGVCKDFLDFVITAPSAPRSVKISGEMDILPSSTTLSMLVDSKLRKLHLSKTGLSSEVLSRLQNMELLVCLRLTEDRRGPWDDGNFLVEADKFPSLEQICFHGPKLPRVQIQEGAMPRLISLQLICPEPEEELGVTGITHLRKLNEVMLHPDASENKMEKWKAAAVQHRNRPYVLKQPSCNRHE